MSQIIFVSCSKHDLDFATLVVGELRKRNYSVWIYEDSITSGTSEDILDIMSDALKDADHFLAILSSHSVDPRNSFAWKEIVGAYRLSLKSDLKYHAIMYEMCDIPNVFIEGLVWKGYYPNKDGVVGVCDRLGLIDGSAEADDVSNTLLSKEELILAIQHGLAAYLATRKSKKDGRSRINSFISWLEANYVPQGLASLVYNYLHSHSDDWNSETIKSYLSTIKNVCELAVDYEPRLWMEIYGLRNLVPPRGHSRTVETRNQAYLTQKQLQTIIDAPGLSRTKTIRDTLVMTLLCYGLRPMEIAHLTWANVRVLPEKLSLTIPPIVHSDSGRSLLVHFWVWDLLTEWSHLAELNLAMGREYIFYRVSKSDGLFSEAERTLLSDRSIQRWVKDYSAGLQLQTSLTPRDINLSTERILAQQSVSTDAREYVMGIYQSYAGAITPLEFENGFDLVPYLPFRDPRSVPTTRHRPIQRRFEF